MDSTFRIDTNEPFQHLSKAPIIESVIDLNTQNAQNWEEKAAITFVKERIKEYPLVHSQSNFLQQITLAPNKKVQQQMHSETWLGVRAQTADHCQIMQFNKTGFVFSRLKPYEDWGRFSAEAFKLWGTYKEALKPQKITRIGIRYINQIIRPAQALDIKAYVANMPNNVLGKEIPIAGFLYSEVIETPGRPYLLRIIKTIQPIILRDRNDAGIIIDIDVFTKPDFSCEPGEDLNQYLNELRWIKNKAFFNNITDQCLKELI